MMKRILVFLLRLFKVDLSQSDVSPLALAERSRDAMNDDLAINPDGTVHPRGFDQIRFVTHVAQCVLALRRVHPASMSDEVLATRAAEFWYRR